MTSDVLTDSANKIKIVTDMYKDTGELDTAYDYYAVNVRVHDLTHRGMNVVDVYIALPSYAQELKHQPLAGDYPHGTQCVTFTFYGITIPFVCGGGSQVRVSTGSTAPIGRLWHFAWHHEYDYCGGVTTDYAEYEIGVRVPQGAGLFAYTSAHVEWWGGQLWCYYGDQYNLYWSYVSYMAGGADNFAGSSGSGVADAPDSGSGPSMNWGGGILFGWTGGGDTTLDTVDRYAVSVPKSSYLTVRLYVNGKNFDLCLETWKGTFCSRNSGSSDESVTIFNEQKKAKSVAVRLETPQNQWGEYEMGYYLSPTYTAAMADQGNGAAYARASGGASCSVTGSSAWTKFYDDGTTRKYSQSVRFADYESIKGRIWTVLDAPGLADESYFHMDVYKDGTFWGSYATSSGGTWSGYVSSEARPIGTSGTWKFVVTVWGLDYGSQQCWARGEFYVYDT